MKTHTFKTLVFKEGENKGGFAYICDFDTLISISSCVCYTEDTVIDDFVFLYPDIDFSQVELKTVEVTIK